MARTSAISLASGSADLKELYGYVIENVQKDALSVGLKSQAWTGNPKAGSVEFTRFKNATAKTYGTARTAQKGDAIDAPAVTVNLSTHKEIVEEMANFDIETFGVANVLARRADNHPKVMAVDLDTAFFTTAGTRATSVTVGGTDIAVDLETIIQKLETVKNAYVDGVDRDMMAIVLTPAKFGLIRTALDSLPSSNVDTASEKFGMYHGVKVYSSTRLPSGVNCLCMTEGAIAQPVVVNEYTAPADIPLSNDKWVGLFYDYGTVALTPELIFKF